MQYIVSQRYITQTQMKTLEDRKMNTHRVKKQYTDKGAKHIKEITTQPRK